MLVGSLDFEETPVGSDPAVLGNMAVVPAGHRIARVQLRSGNGRDRVRIFRNNKALTDASDIDAAISAEANRGGLEDQA
jgi:hypothetical protein